MKVRIEIDVTNCGDCPFRKEYRSRESYDYCDRKDAKGYPYSIVKTNKIPEWCPLGIKEENETIGV